MFNRICIIYFLLTTFYFPAQSQEITQTLRGTVIDQVTNSPLPGATVILLNSSPLNGMNTDIDGNFRIDKVPVGKKTLRVTYLGYKEQIIPNIIINSGKEMVLTITLEEDFIQGKEVEITAETDKRKALNEMSKVSARTFSVEETQKFAAAVNDPARMASSFAGVVSTDDGNNLISIRGNSPNGLLWRMEGIEIPNPNHFSAPGSAGGGISILSSQTLANSDFLTGAFAAEYGNALSGVFDLKLRKGNNEKQEFTFQAGFLGIDLSAEGPIRKNYNGSYLVNYRYSTLSLLNNIGVNVGEGVTTFQDISFNISVPTKKAGIFSLFGFGGLSKQDYQAKKDSSKWENEFERYNSIFSSNTGAVGLSHSIILNNKAYLKTTLSASASAAGYDAEILLDDNYKPEKRHDELNDNNKFTFSSVLNYKQNARLNFRSGVIASRTDYTIEKRTYDGDLMKLITHIDTKGSLYTMQLFTQASYQITEKLEANAGVHYHQLFLNNSISAEPRASISYEINTNNNISLGYGLHSQIQPIGVYFAKINYNNGFVLTPNKNLDFSKSHHLVLAYDRNITQYMHVKVEMYYQSLYNIPVRSDIKNSFSITNEANGYITDPLANNGKGSNYGVDLTLEQFMRKDLYFLLSGSLYDSRYKGSDGVEHDTRYNGNYSMTFTAGKEIKTGSGFKNRIIGINIKTMYRGGFRDTPIDFDASVNNSDNETVYFEDEAFSIKYPDYFRTDIRISLKRNRLKATHTMALDIQNVSNRKNIYGKFYDANSGTIKTYYQTPLIPIFSYKIEF
jgi:CarboxypepD_reg-like domain/TonB-dependent Receptor Plug Domain